MDSKEIVNEVLDFLKYKVNNDTCTPDEIRNLSNILTKELGTIGTIEEMAEFFGVSESNLRAMISRKVTDKPKRRVYYKFMSILKNVPDKWLNNRKKG